MSPLPQATTGRHPLFEPDKMGPLELPNRFAMAPLTRMCAGNPHSAPTALHAEYYAQRAGAGLIVGEATAISPDGFGWVGSPGLWSAEQVAADLIAFGRPFISNPDFAARLAACAPLADIDWDTVYGGGAHGYSDYPALETVTQGAS